MVLTQALTAKKQAGQAPLATRLYIETQEAGT